MYILMTLLDALYEAFISWVTILFMVSVGSVSAPDNNTDSSQYNNSSIFETIDTYNNYNNNSNNNNNTINGNKDGHHNAIGLFTNASATTYAGPASAVPLSVGIQVEEIIIVSLIVLFWVMAVAAFRRKWDSIRIMQPMEPRYKHIPKNLDSVKVVKRAQDSVIYKTYSRKMSVTMVARENRHLQRTLTMPCMNTLPSLHEALGSNPGSGTAAGPVGPLETMGPSGSKRLKKKPTLPTIQMEEVATTEM